MSNLHTFPVIDSKGGEGQRFIEAHPDSRWGPKDGIPDGWEHPPILEKAGYLLVTGGQRLNVSRLTAVASEEKYVGNGWIPVTGMEPDEAKGAAVFINSTLGRLQLFLRPAKTLDYPQYNPNVVADLMIPDLGVKAIRTRLASSWEQTRFMEVPLTRDGECEVRRIWDHAVADALGIDHKTIDQQRNLLHQEPLVTGRSYGDVLVV